MFGNRLWTRIEDEFYGGQVLGPHMAMSSQGDSKQYFELPTCAQHLVDFFTSTLSHDGVGKAREVYVFHVAKINFFGLDCQTCAKTETTAKPHLSHQGIEQCTLSNTRVAKNDDSHLPGPVERGAGTHRRLARRAPLTLPP